MMNRRRALIGMSAAVIGVIGSSSSALARTVRWATAASRNAVLGAQSKDAATDAIDARLRRDIALLSPRADSEEGVPVILVCENLVIHKSAHAQTPVQLTAFNTAIVSEFRRNAEAWERIQPNSPEGDVGKLIQILAYRDFANREMEQRA